MSDALDDTDDSFLAEADLTEDFGFDHQHDAPNPINRATFRAMENDYDEEDLDEAARNRPDFFFDDPFDNEEQFAAAQAAFEDLAQQNLDLDGLNAALGLPAEAEAAGARRALPPRYRRRQQRRQQRQQRRQNQNLDGLNAPLGLAAEAVAPGVRRSPRDRRRRQRRQQRQQQRQQRQRRR